jgi:hypothetical protein
MEEIMLKQQKEAEEFKMDIANAHQVKNEIQSQAY